MHKGRVDGYRVAKQLRVGNDDPATIVSFDHCRPSLDLLYSSFKILEDNLVINLKWLRQENKNSG